MDSKLYVGNLSYTTTEDSLKAHFQQAGTVTSVAIIMDRDTGRSKGFGFIEMSSATEAAQAIRLLHSSSLEDRAINVSMARPREEGGSSRNGSGGGSRRERF